MKIKSVYLKRFRCNFISGIESSQKFGLCLYNTIFYSKINKNQKFLKTLNFLENFLLYVSKSSKMKRLVFSWFRLNIKLIYFWLYWRPEFFFFRSYKNLSKVPKYYSFYKSDSFDVVKTLLFEHFKLKNKSKRRLSRVFYTRFSAAQFLKRKKFRRKLSGRLVKYMYLTTWKSRTFWLFNKRKNRHLYHIKFASVKYAFLRFIYGSMLVFKRVAWKVLKSKNRFFRRNIKERRNYKVSKLHFYSIFRKILLKFKESTLELPSKTAISSGIIVGAAQTNQLIISKKDIDDEISSEEKQKERLMKLKLENFASILSKITAHAKISTVNYNFIRRERHRPRRMTRRKGSTYMRQFISLIMLGGKRDKAIGMLKAFSFKLRKELYQRWLIERRKVWSAKKLFLASKNYKERHDRHAYYKKLISYKNFLRLLASISTTDLLSIILTRLEPRVHIVKYVKSGNVNMVPSPLRWRRRVYYSCKFLQKGAWAAGKVSGEKNSFAAGLVSESLKILLPRLETAEVSVAENNLNEMYDLVLKQKDFIYLCNRFLRRTF